MVCSNTASRLYWINFSRTINGIGWTTAGRDHIHHKLMKKFSPQSTLLMILTITLLTGIFGIIVEIIFTSYISTLLFFVYAFLYYLFTGYFWKKFFWRC